MDLHRRREDRTRERLQPPREALCAVCGKELELPQESEHVEFASRTLWFCTEACREEFERHPLRFED